MIDILIFLLRILGIILGVLLISTRLLYQTEQGELQSRLQDMWIIIDDLQKKALSRHVAFVNVMASMVTSLSERVFGRKLISLQSLTVTICYAVVSACFVVMLCEYYLHKSIDSTTPSVFLVFFCAGTIPAIIPFFTKSKIKQKKYVSIWLTVMLTLAFVKIILPYVDVVRAILLVEDKQFFSFFILLSLSVLIALGLFTSFVIVSRLGFRWLSTSKSASRIALTSLLNVSPIFVMYLILKLGFAKISHSQLPTDIDPKNVEQAKIALTSLGNQLNIAVVFTLIFVLLLGLVFLIPAIFFLLFSAAMVIHRILWPILHRPLYKLQELEITQ